MLSEEDLGGMPRSELLKLAETAGLSTDGVASTAALRRMIALSATPRKTTNSVV